MLGQQGRERAIREFSWDAIADRVDRIIIAVASGKYGSACSPKPMQRNVIQL